MEYTVGEIARLGGLTVRALHHYEKLGLLHPTGRSQAGYRLYTDEDVLTLHRIVAYQQMGMALKDIAPLLGPGAPSLESLLERQIAAAEVRLARQQRLLASLRRVERRAREGGPELTDHLLRLLSEMRTYERWFSDEELQRMHDAQEKIGHARLLEIKSEFDAIMAGMRVEMERGAAPTDDAVAALARRLVAIGPDSVEDEATLREKGRAMFAAEPALQQRTGITLALLDFIDAAVEACKARAA